MIAKVKEIKEALECCKENEDTNGLAYCHRCPFGGHVSCEQELYQKSLTLINELESENERLNGKIKDMEFVGVGNCLSCDINEQGYKDMVKRVELEEQNEALNKSIEKLTSALQQDHEDRERFRARNQQLKDRIAELEKENEILRKAKTLDDNIANEMINMLKQFAERLKGKFEHCIGDIYHADTIDERIDETLKEFL